MGADGVEVNAPGERRSEGAVARGALRAGWRGRAGAGGRAISEASSLFNTSSS